MTHTIEAASGRTAAAIDIGTNSVLLLVAHASAAGAAGVFSVLEERATVTRLGQGVDKTRRLAPEAMARTRACLETYATVLQTRGVPAACCAIVGTSAMRDAEGSDVFRREIEALFGAPVRTLSGDEEAELTFRGALSGLSVPREDAAVFDIGGGSTEIVSAGGYAHSFDIGAVRLHERHIKSDPPTSEELMALEADAASSLAPLKEANNANRVKAEALVGVAGTVTTLAAIHFAIAPYDGARVHGARMTRDEVQAVAGMLAKMTRTERERVPGLDPKRADVIVAGAYITLAVLDALGANAFIASDRGVRWGLVEQMLKA